MPTRNKAREFGKPHTLPPPKTSWWRSTLGGGGKAHPANRKNLAACSQMSAHGDSTV